MITDALIGVVNALVGVIINLIPPMPDLSGISGAVRAVWPYINTKFFPLGHLLIAVGIYTSVWLAVSGLKVVKMIANFVRGSGA